MKLELVRDSPSNGQRRKLPTTANSQSSLMFGLLVFFSPSSLRTDESLIRVSHSLKILYLKKQNNLQLFGIE